MAHAPQPPRPVNTPTPGFYKTKLVKGGPFVPARIMERDGLWLVLLIGIPTDDVAKAEPWSVRLMERVAFSHAITEAEYLALIEEYRDVQPGSALADPTTAIDWRKGNTSR